MKEKSNKSQLSKAAHLLSLLCQLAGGRKRQHLSFIRGGVQALDSKKKIKSGSGKESLNFVQPSEMVCAPKLHSSLNPHPVKVDHFKPLVESNALTTLWMAVSRQK